MWSKCSVQNPYVVKSTKRGVQSSTKGKGAFKVGRKVGFLHRHLEGVDRRCMGVKYCRVSNTIQSRHRDPPPEAVFSDSIMGGSSVPGTERYHPPTGREPRGFLLNSASTSGWMPLTSKWPS